MSVVVDLSAWRLRRKGLAEADEPTFREDAAIDSPESPHVDPAVDRLDRAVRRLHALVSAALDGSGRLQPRVETELLAIMGELTVGLVREAADRAERLAGQLAR
jgi:hypothetical protein